MFSNFSLEHVSKLNRRALSKLCNSGSAQSCATIVRSKTSIIFSGDPVLQCALRHSCTELS